MSQEPDYKALVHEALAQINRLKGQLKQHADDQSAPIAIVGYGCRLPGQVQDERGLLGLMDGVEDVITASANVRFNLDSLYDSGAPRRGKTYTRALGMLHGYESFDADFFGLSELEAERLDPQQRLLLETSWEALERGGMVPEHLEGSDTGVYVGISTQEYAQMVSTQHSLDQICSHDGPGSSLAVAAGRLSYFYGFHGPAVAIDSACSSVLVCVHEAMQALRSRKIDTALAGGVNLIINPLMMLVFSDAGVLSRQGQQRCFDESADGYVRSEACTMLSLKRLDDAQAQGLPILAVLKGGAVNHNGHTQGITAPSESAQQQVIRMALADAGLRPDQVDALEAHATGTALGDFIELSAIQSVYGEERQRPLWLSSIKSRIGHAETGAAGPALLHAVMQLRRRQLGAQLHFDQPNALFAWNESPLQVPTESMAWPGDGVTAVSGFGYNGTNAHIILTGADDSPSADESDMPLAGLKLSARTPQALQALAKAWSQFLAQQPSASLASILAMANGGRSDFSWRVWVPAANINDLQVGCEALTQGRGLPANAVRSRKTSSSVSLPLSSEAAKHWIDDWLAGNRMPWRDLYPRLASVDLPTYPFQRKRLWPEVTNAIIQLTQLQYLSSIQLFLGQHFPEPDAERYHGYLGDDHPALGEPYLMHGASGVPPLWPVVAVASALPLTTQAFSNLVWGEWLHLVRYQHLRLHSQIDLKQVNLYWSAEDNANWRPALKAEPVAFAEPSIGISVADDAGPVEQLVTPWQGGALFQRITDLKASSTHLYATIATTLAAKPLGHWMNQPEVDYAQNCLTLLGVVQAGFDVCQAWGDAEHTLLPSSCDQFRLHTQSLLQAIESQSPLTSVFELMEDVGGGLLARWQIQDQQGQPLLEADQLVLYRIDSQRLNAGRTATADVDTEQGRVLEVDLSAYRQALSSLLELDPQARRQQLLTMLCGQLSELCGTEVDADASLMSLGIDSLWAMEFRARLQTELSLQLPIAFLLRGPTLAQLAEHLADQMGADTLASASTDTTSPGDDHYQDSEELML